jgi:hypothetical protein
VGDVQASAGVTSLIKGPVPSIVSTQGGRTQKERERERETRREKKRRERERERERCSV